MDRWIYKMQEEGGGGAEIQGSADISNANHINNLSLHLSFSDAQIWNMYVVFTFDTTALQGKREQPFESLKDINSVLKCMS